MGNTPIYGFGYIEPNQDLSENIDLDELRFKSIENQMFNLYQIFKNGIIEKDPNTPSWRIQTYANDFKLTKILITSGEGFVSYKAAKTDWKNPHLLLSHRLKGKSHLSPGSLQFPERLRQL